MPTNFTLAYRSGQTVDVDRYVNGETLHFTITDCRNPPTDPAAPGQGPLFDIAIAEGDGELGLIENRTDEDGNYIFSWKPTSARWMLELQSRDPGFNTFCVKGGHRMPDEEITPTLEQRLQTLETELRAARSQGAGQAKKVKKLLKAKKELEEELRRRDLEAIEEKHQRELEVERNKRLGHRLGLTQGSSLGNFLKNVFYALCTIIALFLAGVFILMFAGHCGGGHPPPPIDPPEQITPVKTATPSVSLVTVCGNGNTIPRHPKDADVQVTAVCGDCNRQQLPCCKKKKPRPAPATE